MRDRGRDWEAPPRGQVENRKGLGFDHDRPTKLGKDFGVVLLPEGLIEFMPKTGTPRSTSRLRPAPPPPPHAVAHPRAIRAASQAN